jgi:Ca-activated chloride channel homolog
MAFNQFHFIQAIWLWGLLGIPLAMLIYATLYKGNSPSQLLERFADRHLLPHLVRRRSLSVSHIRRPFLLWALAWLCGIVAMAGPSWNYSDQQTFKTAENLVIILDLSQSMNARDVKPSRVARARQEIQDLLDLSHGVDIGLIAYAAVPHMVTPLTDDVRTIENLLPDLDTSLITVQGDRLQPALAMAAKMLKAEPSKSNSILVISDGAFQESDFAGLAQAAGNAEIYTMGVGTSAIVATQGSQLWGETENATVSGLQRTRLQQLAAAGHGLYVEANYSDSDTRAILDRIDAAKGSAQITPTSVRLWEDRFYIPLLALLVLLLPLFRNGAAFAVAGILTMTMFPAVHAHAGTAVELFLNKNQQADAAFGKRDYKDALAKFDTDYRRGVVAYRAGRYKQAAALFKSAAKRSNDIDALYNLGNAQLMQLQPEDAIFSYEAVLKQKPGDVPAQHNLAIARKMLEQQHQKSNKDDKSDGKNKDKTRDQRKQQSKGGQGEQQNGQRQHSDTSNQSQAANSGRPQGQQQGKSGSAQQPASPGGQAGSGQLGASHENGPPAGGRAGSLANAHASPNGPSASADQRKQMDARADEWLTRLPSDPGSFLRNQFRIEEGQSSGGQ